MSKDPRILAMIERFNFSPTTIGYAALTEQLEQFAMSHLKAGMTEACKVVQNRADIYDAEHGHTDRETGTREYPKNGDDYMLELTEIIEAIAEARDNKTIAEPPEAALKPDATGKAPYLFYYEDAENCWTPVPERLDQIINLENFSYDGEKIEIEFQRSDMTPEQFANLPVI